MCKHLQWTSDFKCIHCHAFITTESIFSGVRNRNHCPYCLWSKHLDLHQAGDRLSACKAGMQPVGLTLKKTWKKYGIHEGGELMIIHQCTGCGSISINRIAADDGAERIFEIYEGSLKSGDNNRAGLQECGVIALGPRDREIVFTRLFGLDHCCLDRVPALLCTCEDF